jgi:hypothetical protein
MSRTNSPEAAKVRSEDWHMASSMRRKLRLMTVLLLALTMHAKAAADQFTPLLVSPLIPG